MTDNASLRFSPAHESLMRNMIAFCYPELSNLATLSGDSLGYTDPQLFALEDPWVFKTNINFQNVLRELVSAGYLQQGPTVKEYWVTAAGLNAYKAFLTTKKAEQERERQDEKNSKISRWAIWGTAGAAVGTLILTVYLVFFKK